MNNQLQEYQQITCDECDKPVRVRQNKPYGLELRCDCDSRSIKVHKALPLEWSQ